MTVRLHRLDRDVVCEAQIPHTDPVPGVILYQGRAFILGEVPLRFDPRSHTLSYLETVLYVLPASAVRAEREAFFLREAQS